MTPDEGERTVERFARVRPPAGHAGRVRARSGPGATTHARPARAATALPLRWVLPVAASAMVVIGAVWQSDRASRQIWIDAPPVAPQWSGKGVDVPVLPPRAYWTMSAFDEFESLRGHTAVLPSARRNSMAATAVAVTPPVMAGDWMLPLSLPPIVIEDITTEPIQVVEISAPTPIALAPIDIVPIDIGSGEQEER